MTAFLSFVLSVLGALAMLCAGGGYAMWKGTVVPEMASRWEAFIYAGTLLTILAHVLPLLPLIGGWHLSGK